METNNVAMMVQKFSFDLLEIIIENPCMISFESLFNKNENKNGI